MPVPDQLLKDAIEHHQAGRLQHAELIYSDILLLDPSHSDALHLIGVIHIQRGDFGKAIEKIGCAIKVRSNFAPYHNNIGLAYKESHRLDDAKSSFEESIRIDPDYASAYLNLGHVLRELACPKAAIVAYEKSIQCQPNLSEAYHGYGKILQELGKIHEASIKHQAAGTLAPQFAEAHFHYAETMEDLGKYEEALDGYRKTIQIKPGHIEAHFAAGAILEKLGKREEAQEWWIRSFSLPIKDGDKFRAGLATPIIFQSAEEMKIQRRCLEERIALLEAENLSIGNPLMEVNLTNFYAAYHGLNNRDIQKRIAALYLRATPSLAFTAPHCQELSLHRGGRILRIGFVSRFFHMHTIGEVTLGFFQKLSRKKFEVFLFCLPGPDDDLGRLIRSSADHVVQLPSTIEEARRCVANECLDILFYSDIGMDPFTYYLAFARLAPVQCVTWGHPDTTGIPTLDYYLSSDDQEPDDADGHYSEKLIRLPGLPTYYIAPAVFPPSKNRSFFNLEDNTHYYMCTQAPFKVHPDFDKTIGEILRRDPAGKVLFVRGHNSFLTHELIRRFHRSIPDVVGRIQFLPHQKGQNYLHLLPLCDALLDTTFFSGGNTALKAFSVGAPIVTIPGSFARSRTTFACYKRMGIMDCVASDLEDYVRISLRLAHDRPWRKEICDRIQKKRHVLFEDSDVVRAMEDFFVKAVECNLNLKAPLG